MNSTRRHLVSAAAMGLAWPALAAPAPSALDKALKLPVLVDGSDDAAKGIFFGIFREDALPDVVATTQSDLRRQPAAAMWFTRFESAFPESQLRFLAQRNIAAQVTWEPWGHGNKPITLADIVEGRWDAYIDTWAQAAAKLDLPFMLRFGHEFNGDWYPWCTVNNERQPELFVKAHRRVVQRFRDAGAHQVQWVWCFNNASAPAASWNDPRAAWPGDEFVDWIGIDGYNFGSSRSWSRWTSFADVFSDAVATARAISPDKPIVLAELGCSETGGDKAAWIARMFSDIESLPNVRAFTWFDTVKETSWSLTSSDESWLAAIQSLRRASIRGNGHALLSISRKRRPT
ncbi:glycoside hydrolase family 26 protein [Piscinibacter terrae]|uniref:GH26 domain-containing protein n=1 Tax=Piscinibacter terrae TaxID=2496871 RepID=A0A3N7HZG3_9BURK|nr:glycosyl hydrolase [Albitalea terrae]RQP26511.1 hypothetical protein DZC73_05760 [Albitalea terrae]